LNGASGTASNCTPYAINVGDSASASNQFTVAEGNNTIAVAWGTTGAAFNFSILACAEVWV
jgi:hypothetical protein